MINNHDINFNNAFMKSMARSMSFGESAVNIEVDYNTTTLIKPLTDVINDKISYLRQLSEEVKKTKKVNIDKVVKDFTELDVATVDMKTINEDAELEFSTTKSKLLYLVDSFKRASTLADVDFLDYQDIIDNLDELLYEHTHDDLTTPNGLIDINTIRKSDYEKIIVCQPVNVNDVKSSFVKDISTVLSDIEIYIDLLQTLTFCLRNMEYDIKNEAEVRNLNVLIAILRSNIVESIYYITASADAVITNAVNMVSGKSANSVPLSSPLYSLGILEEQNNIDPINNVIGVYESKRLLTEIIVEVEQMKSFNRLMSYSEALPSAGLLKQSMTNTKLKVQGVGQGLSDIVSKVIQMLQNLIRSITNGEKELPKLKNDISKALQTRTYNTQFKKSMDIYTLNDLKRGGISNDKDSNAMRFARNIERDKSIHTSRKIDFSSKDAVKKTLEFFVPNFEKLSDEEYIAAIRRKFNYLDVDVTNSVDAKKQASNLANKATSTKGFMGISNTVSKVVGDKLTTTKESGKDAYNYLVESLNLISVLSDGFMQLKGVQWLMDEQKQMTKIANQLKKYTGNVKSATQNNKFMASGQSYAVDDMLLKSIIAKGYGEGIADNMSSANIEGTSSATQQQASGGDEIPSGDADKEAKDKNVEKVEDEKTPEDTKKITNDLGEYKDKVSTFISQYAQSINYNIVFYNTFLKSLLKVGRKCLIDYYACTAA